MTANGWLQIAIFFALILVCAKPLGSFIATFIEGRRNFLTPILKPIELIIYKLSGVKVDAEGNGEEQHWTRYAGALLAFSVFNVLFLYAMQRLQKWLPFNPQGYSQDNVSPDLGFNTAVSFATNTNWQSYTPETTLSYFIQMAGLTVHNFTSAAAGLAIAIALVRGFARQSIKTIGNFWVDMTRSTLYVLLPLSIVAALLLVLAGFGPESSPLHRGHYRRRRKADDRAGARGFSGSDQDARHQRRRFLQRQLRASLRESDSVREHAADVSDFPHPRRVDLHVRQNGARHPPGLGDLHRHGPVVVGRSSGRLSLRAEGHAFPCARPESKCRPPTAAAPRSPAATWKARRRASVSPTPRSSRPSPPTPAAVLSIPCTTVSRPSADWCHSSIWSWVK